MSITSKKIKHENLVEDVNLYGINIYTRELFVGPNAGQTYEDAIIDHVVANMFIRNLSILTSINNDPVTIHLITCGGDWNYGMAMFDAIQKSPCHITTISYAHARSMSSIIPQAADLRIIMPNADFLLHYGTASVSGNAISVVSEAHWLTYQNNQMIEIYTNRCKQGKYFAGKTDNYIRGWLRKQLNSKQEVYLTPNEAVAKGFMDIIK